jgi:hypothetical protein
LHCEECVRFFLLKLIRLSDVKGWSNDQIVILGSYQNARSLFVYTEQLGVRFPVYNMEPPDLPAEKLSAPYCFITDRSLQVMHFFVPDKYVGEISNYYLDLVANRYFKLPKLEIPQQNTE